MYWFSNLCGEVLQDIGFSLGFAFSDEVNPSI
jgi:hypothetical protein